MKKLLLASLAGAFLLCSTTAKAVDSSFSVYNNGTLNSDLRTEYWWNAGVDLNASLDGQTVFKFTAAEADKATDASMGFQTQNYNTGYLHNATLNFDWYAEGTGTYALRLTGKYEYNYSLGTVTAETAGQWHSVSLPIATTPFTTTATTLLSDAWNEDIANGVGYVFAVILTNGQEGDAIYFRNINYSNVDVYWVAPDHEVLAEPTTVPTPEINKDDVFSVFGYYGNISFGQGGWGETTKPSTVSIAGQNVYKLTDFNYLGWYNFGGGNFNVSDYTYMHVDYWTPNGTSFAFTPISPGPKEKGWVAPSVAKEEWNSFDAPLSYFSEAGVDLSDIFQIKFDNGGDATGYIANVYFYGKSDDEGGNGGDDNDGEGNGNTFSGSITGTFKNAWVSGTDESSRADTPFTAYWSATWNKDMTITFNMTVNPMIVGLVPQLFLNGGLISAFTETAGNFSYTTTDKYNENAAPDFSFFFAYNGGATDQFPFSYVVGSTNDFVATSISATLDNVTAEETDAAVTINYTVSEDLMGKTITVAIVDAQGNAPEFTPATFTAEDTTGAQTIEISGLTELTKYSYTLTLSATVDDEQYTSAPLAVEFSTLGTEQGNGKTFTSAINGVLTQGTTDYNYYILYAITWNQNLTITVNATVKFSGAVPGMVAPQLWYNGQHISLNVADGPATTADEIEYTVTKNYTGTPEWTFSNPDGKTSYNLYFRFEYEGDAVATPVFAYIPGDDANWAGVTNVMMDYEMDAPVEYFNLQGARIENPAAGQIVIKRQGSKVAKMIVR